MSQSKIVLLNGPSGSGKTSGGRAAAKWFGQNCISFGFADDLKRATHASLGMWNQPFDQYEAVKNVPHPDFFGLTPRKAYIAHSEVYMKQVYGSSIFSRLACRKIDSFVAQQHGEDTFIVLTDCGFDVEADYLCHRYGSDNVLLLRLHREGYTFEGDSRNYIKNPPCFSWDISNNSTFDHFVDDLTRFIAVHFLGAYDATRIAI